MADWSTVAIAAITGFAGLGGNFLQSFMTDRNQDKAHKREDAAVLRSKLEELSCELDEISWTNSQHATLIVRMLNGSVSADQPPPKPVNLGKLRANVGMYFPECQTAIATYDANALENGRQGRENADRARAEVVNELLAMLLVGTQHVTNLCHEMRIQLAIAAGRVGTAK